MELCLWRLQCPRSDIERLLRQAVVACPESIELTIMLLDLLGVDGRYDEEFRLLEALAAHAGDSPHVLLYKAFVALREGDHDRADSLTAEAARIISSSGDRELALQLAGVWIRMPNRREDAFALVRELRVASPDQPATYLWESILHEVSRDPDLAAEALREGRRRWQGSQEEWDRFVAQLRFNLSAPFHRSSDDGIDLASDAALCPSSGAAWRTRHHTDRDDISVRSGLAMRSYSGLVIRRAQKALRRGQTEKAIDIAHAHTRRKPHDPRAWLLLDSVLGSAGVEPEQIEDALRMGLKSLPNDPELSARLALSMRLRGRHEDAAAILEKARSRAPDSPALQTELASIAIRSGDWASAERHLDAALSGVSYHEDPELFLEICVGLLFIPERESLGRQLLREVVEDTDNAMALLLLSMATEEDDKREAQSLLSRAERNWDSPRPFDSVATEARAQFAKRHPGEAGR